MRSTVRRAMLVALFTSASLASCSTDPSDDASPFDPSPSISAACSDDRGDVLRRGSYDVPRLDESLFDLLSASLAVEADGMLVATLEVGGDLETYAGTLAESNSVFPTRMIGDSEQEWTVTVGRDRLAGQFAVGIWVHERVDDTGHVTDRIASPVVFSTVDPISPLPHPRAELDEGKLTIRIPFSETRLPDLPTFWHARAGTTRQPRIDSNATGISLDPANMVSQWDDYCGPDDGTMAPL